MATLRRYKKIKMDVDNVKQQDNNKDEYKEKRIIKLRNIYDEDQTVVQSKKKNQKYDPNKDSDNLDQLDHWKEQLNSKKKVQVFDLQFDTEQTKTMEFHYDQEQGPNINQEIMNQIVRNDPRQKKKVDTADPLPDNQEVAVKFQMLRKNGETSNFKTSEQVRIDMNKKLLNSLLLDKIQRRVDQAQKVQPWAQNHIDVGTAQIFSEQAKLLKMNTLNNFKGLTEYFKNSAQFIDYEQVLIKAKHYSNKPMAFTNNNSYVPPTTTSHSIKSIMENYQQIQQYILEHKTLLYDLRINNNQLTMEQQKLEDDIIQMKRKYYSREERARQGHGQSTQDISSMKKTTRNNVVESLDRLRQQRENEQQMTILQIQQIRMNIQQNIDKQNIIQKELDDLRDKKQRSKMLLKESFMNQLKKAQQNLCCESLVSIVKQLRRINELPKGVHFPQYLDDTSIQFVFKVASLEQQVEEVRVQAGLYQQSTVHLEVFSQYQGSVSEIKQKVKNYLQPQKYYMKRPSTQGSMQEEKQQFFSLTTNNEFPFKASRIQTEQVNFQNKDLNLRLIVLQQQLEQITSSECSRLIKLYMNKKTEQDAQELRYIYCALFGQNQGEMYWQSYMNLWCEKYNINPHKLVNGSSANFDNLQHAALPAIPENVKNRVNRTMKSLVQEVCVSYDYDLLDKKISPVQIHKSSDTKLK